MQKDEIYFVRDEKYLLLNDGVSSHGYMAHEYFIKSLGSSFVEVVKKESYDRLQSDLQKANERIAELEAEVGIPWGQGDVVTSKEFIDLHARETIRLEKERDQLKAELAEAEKVISRLGSSEAFYAAGEMDEECRLRIEYARAYLAKGKK